MRKITDPFVVNTFLLGKNETVRIIMTNRTVLEVRKRNLNQIELTKISGKETALTIKPITANQVTIQ